LLNKHNSIVLLRAVHNSISATLHKTTASPALWLRYNRQPTYGLRKTVEFSTDFYNNATTKMKKKIKRENMKQL
jgi:hypothetical protein